jgi:hypothetical protein
VTEPEKRPLEKAITYASGPMVLYPRPLCMIGTPAWPDKAMCLRTPGTFIDRFDARISMQVFTYFTLLLHVIVPISLEDHFGASDELLVPSRLFSP